MAGVAAGAVVHAARGRGRRHQAVALRGAAGRRRKCAAAMTALRAVFPMRAAWRRWGGPWLGWALNTSWAIPADSPEASAMWAAFRADTANGEPGHQSGHHRR